VEGQKRKESDKEEPVKYKVEIKKKKKHQPTNEKQ
jgi:hypothetical protein